MVNTHYLIFVLGVSEAEKQEIIDFHNRVRRDVTGATDMQVLVRTCMTNFTYCLPSKQDLYVPFYNFIY